MARDSEGGRLAAVASLVRRGARVADVGTDHAALALRLLEDDTAVACIASDRDASALARARRRVSRSRWADRIELRAGDGLSALHPRDRVDTVVIAGLGARGIIEILRGGDLAGLGIRRLVLQPQSETGALRRWLFESGFAMTDELVVRERGRFYEVIATDIDAGPMDLSHPTLDRDRLLEAGPCLLRRRDPLALALWERRARRLALALERSRSETSRSGLRERLRSAREIVAALTGTSDIVPRPWT